MRLTMYIVMTPPAAIIVGWRVFEVCAPPDDGCLMGDPSKHDRCLNNNVLLLGQLHRRWIDIKTSLFQSVVFAGIGTHKSWNAADFQMCDRLKLNRFE